MAIELKVPSVGESVTEVEIGPWLKREGDAVNKDENVVTLESEKATVELPSPASGTLGKIVKRTGEKAMVGDVIALDRSLGKPAAQAGKARQQPPASISRIGSGGNRPLRLARLPSAKKESGAASSRNHPAQGVPARPDRQEEVVPMTLLRRTVAQRLVEAHQTMAMLTTFNEIDLSAVIALRKQYQETFTRKYGVKLGFMSFFVKAAVEALKASRRSTPPFAGTTLFYHHYFDIGVAIGGGKGLVVPVLRNAERMSFAEMEKAVAGSGGARPGQSAQAR